MPNSAAVGVDAVAQREASGIRGLIRRSTVSGVPAGALGLVVLVGVVASQGASPAGPPPSVQQLSPADEAEVRPAPAARVRQQSPARAATQGRRTAEARGVAARQQASRVAPPSAAPQPSAPAEDVSAESGSGDRDAVAGLEDCVEQILTTPGDVGC